MQFVFRAARAYPAEGGIVLFGPQTLGGRRSPLCEAPRMSAACLREVHR